MPISHGTSELGVHVCQGKSDILKNWDTYRSKKMPLTDQIIGFPLSELLNNLSTIVRDK